MLEACNESPIRNRLLFFGNSGSAGIGSPSVMLVVATRQVRAIILVTIFSVGKKDSAVIEESWCKSFRLYCRLGDSN